MRGGPKCERAFQAIKDCLASPLILSQPVEGEELYLYVAASAPVVRVALVRTAVDGRQRLVFFCGNPVFDSVQRKVTAWHNE